MSCGSSVSPNILGFLCVGSVSLFIWRFRVVLCCEGSGVKSVVVVLDVQPLIIIVAVLLDGRWVPAPYRL